MDGDKEVIETMDLSKLKVPELRKELKTRGLSAGGNKNELMERLQNALKNKNDDTLSAESVDDLDEDLLDDDDDEHLDETESVLNDLDSPVDTATPAAAKQPLKRKSSESGEPTPKQPKKIVLTRNVSEAEESGEEKEKEKSNETQGDETNGGTDAKKVVKLSELSAKERLEMRAKKFGVPLSGDAKKFVRAERFSGAAAGSGGGGGGGGINKKTPISTVVPPPSVDVLKQRAQRFGVSVSTALTKLENQERLDKRKERFGGSPAAVTATTNGSTAAPDKAQQRLERFKQPIK